jgi:hypothetical protein
LILGLLNRLHTGKIFTKIDFHGAYNLLKIRPGDEWKTTFRTCYGHFEYTVMPFGLTNTPVVFQHLMNDIFWEYMDEFVVVYLDDILIFSKNQENHDKHVRLVLAKLQKHGLCAKLEKCEFDKSLVEFLGYVISPDGVSMDKSKVETILSQPHFEASVRMRLTLPKVGTWSPPGLPQLQSSIAEVKTPCLEVFFIPLERP